MLQDIRWWHVIMFAMCACVKTVTGQCTGTVMVLTAYDDYQVFTSVNYPYGYGNDRDCLWRLEADNITDAIRLEITDISVEFHANCVYDYGEVFDGDNYTSDSLGKFCGTYTSNYVSALNYMTVRFISDYSLYSKGFKARYKSGPRDSLLDEEETISTISSLVIIGSSLGAMAFMLFIIGITFTYIQLKKAKDNRRHRVRGMSSRVEPMDYGAWSYLDGPAPPAYGELYSSPMSPPPTYSEVDPNPNAEERLPGRAEYMDGNGERNTGSTNIPPAAPAAPVARAASAAPAAQSWRSDRNANTHFIARNTSQPPNSAILTLGRPRGIVTERQQRNQASDNALNLPGSVTHIAQTTPTHHAASNTTSNTNIPTVSAQPTQVMTSQDTENTTGSHTSTRTGNNTDNTRNSDPARGEPTESETVSSSRTVPNTLLPNDSFSLPNAVGTAPSADNDIDSGRA